MIEKNEYTEKFRRELQEFILRQKSILDRLQSVEEKLALLENLDVSPTKNKEKALYDYQVNLDEREYTIHDVKGNKASMVSKRNCSALRDLSEIRSRCHTGTGDRSVIYLSLIHI